MKCSNPVLHNYCRCAPRQLILLLGYLATAALLRSDAIFRSQPIDRSLRVYPYLSEYVDAFVLSGQVKCSLNDLERPA
jgi:hypothetical protein